MSPSQDGTLYQHSQGSLSNGAGQHLFVGATAGGELRRTVIAFDVAGAVPAGSTITSASLTLHMSRTQGGEHVVTVHRVLAPWDEGASRASGNEGGGGPSTPGAVTWVHRSFDAVEWEEPGGDFEPAPAAALPVAGAGEYTWESTPELVAQVQAWLDDPAAGFGWLLRGDEEERGTAKRFDSRHTEDPGVRPRLALEFLPPPGP